MANSTSASSAAGEQIKIDPSKPMFQPPSFDGSAAPQFTTSEILWWKNGVWGQCGYAIPNDGGKPTTSNETIYRVHKFIGAELFNLMHRPDVKFSRPFNAEWLFDLNKMCTLGMKRMKDLSIGWTDTRDGDAVHAVNTPRAFTVYPVPYFGERLRQLDAVTWAGQVLKLLGEIMQHSDNDYDDNVTDFFTSFVSQALKRIQNDLATKYLGFTREQTEAANFTIAPTAFSADNYKPDALFTSRELVEERMPEQWWPSTNDLTPIAGIASTSANPFGTRWPESDGFYGDGGATEAAFPGNGVGTVAKPGARP